MNAEIFAIVTCTAGEEWRRLTTVDKAPYELRAEEERRKYEQAMKEYNMVGIMFYDVKWYIQLSLPSITIHCSLFHSEPKT